MPSRCFSCLHPLAVIDYLDLDLSEYEQTNFDPYDPTYTFQYLHLVEHVQGVPHIGRCEHYRSQLVADGLLLDAVRTRSLKGLAFYRALDPSVSVPARRRCLCAALRDGRSHER
jgi:hypothetical protein